MLVYQSIKEFDCSRHSTSMRGPTFLLRSVKAMLQSMTSFLLFFHRFLSLFVFIYVLFVFSAGHWFQLSLLVLSLSRSSAGDVKSWADNEMPLKKRNQEIIVSNL